MEGKSSQSKNTYLVDHESIAELARLERQDTLITHEVMGGVLSDLPLSLEHVTRGVVLDIACGPGGWTRNFATQYPQSEMVGVDISKSMISYAIEEAKKQSLNNVTFRVMDINQRLDFPDETFDFLNVRLILHVLLSHTWVNFLEECHRVLKPGGGIRMTELDDSITTSPTKSRLTQIYSQAMRRAGRSFSQEGANGLNVLPTLRKLLIKTRFHLIQSVPYVLDYSFGTPLHEAWTENNNIGLSLIGPFFVQMGSITQEDLEQLAAQLRREQQQEDFTAISLILSYFARKAG